MKKYSQILFFWNKLDRRTICQISVFLSFAFLLPFFVACSPKNNLPVIENDNPGELVITPSEKKNNACPQLDSKLYQLFLLDDPIPSAEQLGFKVLNEKVQVLLVLAEEDTVIPEGFDLDVGTRVGEQVQVFSPFKVLCDLANLEEVKAIRQPMAPVLE